MALTREHDVNGTRRQLASELRRLRDLSGISGRDLAARIGISQSKVSRIESGAAIPSLPEVTAWAGAVSATEEATRRLVTITENAFTEVQAWRTAMRDRPHLQDEMREQESRASWSQTFQPSVVPGLLQTAEYARRVFSLFREVPYGPEELAAAVAGRLDRQAALFQSDRRFDFLVTEAALRWRPGPSRLLLTQLDRIASLSALDNVRLGVIPSNTTAVTYTSHGFVILNGDGSTDDDPDIHVTVETIHARLNVTGPDDVLLYRRRWDLLCEMALFGDDARRFLTRLGAEIREEVS
ncbi:XRE family transcriptional regulator [Actinomadura sp. KC216]|uniref:helix-turn-helix domain-containing protein n=1 Tax=Actinomadura sp. KC216 TaxID=2530370 RepID=UPI00104A042C|nr:helix-turn-helix transcriptional regulator [Actinomadura sp. KC216]TDB86949.1 XRE family transcriptional regulator [Actinomadura sp. KC216]